MATEPPKPKRKRHWFRFSLKTLVLVLTVFGIWLGLLVHRVNKQKEAVQWVKDHGGWVRYDYEWEREKKSPIEDAEPPGPDWLRELIGIDYFTDVTLVGFHNATVEDIEPLGNLTQLQWLILTDTQVSDITPLRELTQLHVLYLIGTQVTDLDPLRELTQLQQIYLNRTQVSDITPLRDLTQLQLLYLYSTQVSDLSPLTGMKSVTIFLDENQQVTIPEELKDRVVRD